MYMYIHEHELVSYAVTSLIGFTNLKSYFCLYFQCMKLQNSSSLNNPAVHIQEVGMTFSYTKDVSNALFTYLIVFMIYCFNLYFWLVYFHKSPGHK